MLQRTNISSTFTKYCTEGYEFAFNGQEKDQEIYNNQSTTTATFWEYDGRIGRRWNLDPKPQIFISDYAVMGNNPISFNDLLGDKFKTSKDEKTARKIERTAAVRIGLLSDKLKNTNSEEERNNISSSISELQKVSGEINEMRVADDIFTFNKTKSGNGGNTSIDDKGIITMNYSNFYDLVHETKHGYQFLIGDISFAQTGIKGSGALYDITDENQAFKRGFAFGDKGHFKNFSDITDNNIRNLQNPKTGIFHYLDLPNAALNYKTDAITYNKSLEHPYNERPLINNGNKAIIEYYREYLSRQVMSKIKPNTSIMYKR